MLFEVKDQVGWLELEQLPDLLTSLYSVIFVLGSLEPNFNQVLLLSDGEDESDDVLVFELLGDASEEESLPLEVVFVRVFLLLDLEDPAASGWPLLA